MAELLQNDDEQKQNQPAIQANDQQPQLGGQQAQEMGGSQPAQNVQQSAPKPDQKGSGMGQRLSNLKKYVTANQGPAASNIASKIGEQFQDKQAATKQALQKSQQQVQQQVGQEQQRLEQGETLIKSQEEGGKGLFEQGKTEAFIQQPSQPDQATGFEDYGQTAEDRMAQFQRFQAGEVENIDINDRANLQKQIQDLQRKGEMTQSEEGRYQLLRDRFQRPDYTTGQQRLDQLILQSDPNQIKALSQLREAYDPLARDLSGLESELATSREALTGRATGLAQGIQTGLEGASGQFQQQLTQKVEQEKQAATQRFQQAQESLKTGNLTPELLQTLGVAPEQAKSFATEMNIASKVKSGITGATKPDPRVSPQDSGIRVGDEEAQFIKEKFGLTYTPAQIKDLMSKEYLTRDPGTIRGSSPPDEYGNTITPFDDALNRVLNGLGKQKSNLPDAVRNEVNNDLKRRESAYRKLYVGDPIVVQQAQQAIASINNKLKGIMTQYGYGNQVVQFRADGSIGTATKVANPLTAIKKQMATVDTDLSKFAVGPNVENINITGVMQDPEIQRFQALSQLLGRANQQPLEFINPAALPEAGTALGQTGNFNIQQALSALREKYLV